MKLPDDDETCGDNSASSTGRAGAIIPTVRPRTFEELAEREGLDPVEKLRREIENKLAFERREAALSSDLNTLRMLKDIRRRLRSSTKMREDLQREEKQQLAEVEREIEAVRLRIPPQRLKTTE